MCRLHVGFSRRVSPSVSHFWRESLSLVSWCLSYFALHFVFIAYVAYKFVFSWRVSPSGCFHGLTCLSFRNTLWHLCSVLFTNISSRCTHWGALQWKTAAFIQLFGISYPRFYGLAAWAVFYVPDLFGVCHLLLVLWAYSYLCRSILTTCIPRVTQIGPSLCFGCFFLVCCFTRFEQCVVIS